MNLRRTGVWIIAALLIAATAFVALYANSLRHQRLTLLTSCARVEAAPIAWSCKQAIYMRGISAEEVGQLNTGPGAVHALGFDDPNDSKKMLELFLASGVDINSADPTTGSTVLHGLVSSRELQDIQLVLAHGARADLRDKQGRTPLDYAIELQNKHPSEGYMQVIAVLREGTPKVSTHE